MVERKKLALVGLSLSKAEAVREFVQGLGIQFPQTVARIILFGSKARGEGQAESDIDLLLIVRREDWRLSNAISTLAARISLEKGVLLGPVIIGQERWKRMERKKFSLYRNVVKDGILLGETGGFARPF